jgi:hypothetical protein
VIPVRSAQFTDVQRARVSEKNIFNRNPLLQDYIFYMDTGAVMRSAPSVQWMNRQKGTELEIVANEITPGCAHDRRGRMCGH